MVETGDTPLSSLNVVLLLFAWLCRFVCWLRMTHCCSVSAPLCRDNTQLLCFYLFTCSSAGETQAKKKQPDNQTEPLFHFFIIIQSDSITKYIRPKKTRRNAVYKLKTLPKSSLIFADGKRGAKILKWPMTLNASVPLPVSGARSARAPCFRRPLAKKPNALFYQDGSSVVIK